MRVQTMRRVDAWFGVPLCFLCTCWQRLFAKPPVFPAEPKSILFLKLAEQGTSVLARRALLKAISKVGRENVYFLVFEENRFILEVMGILPVQNIISIKTGGLFQIVRETIAALKQIRALKIDTVIDMEFFARSSALLAYLSGAQWRVGLHRYNEKAPYRGNLMTHPLRYQPELHTAAFFIYMLAALELRKEELYDFKFIPEQQTLVENQLLPGFEPGIEELETLKKRLQEICGWQPGQKIVLLNANCSDLLPLRRWASERYVQVARELLTKYPDLYVMFTGAPDESAGAEKLVAEIDQPRCVSLAGKTSMRELLVLYVLAQLLITNDSGPAHFASLTTIETIVIFGPETPKLFAAEGEHTHILWAGIHCSPCVNAYNNRVSKCTDNVCMQSITVAQVLSLAQEILVSIQ